MKFEFTKVQADVLVSGLDALLRAHGIHVVQAVFDANQALQAQAKEQTQPQKSEPQCPDILPT